MPDTSTDNTGMIQVKEATLSIDGTTMELVSLPLFLGEEADEVSRPAWGTRGDVFVGGRKRFQQSTFTCRLAKGQCFPDVEVGCNAAIVQTATYGSGECDDEGSDVLCTLSFTGLIVSVVPNAVEPYGDPTYTVTVRPQYHPAPSYS